MAGLLSVQYTRPPPRLSFSDAYLLSIVRGTSLVLTPFPFKSTVTFLFSGMVMPS